LYEGLPLAVLEAMAAGKPVIASAIPGTCEAVVDGETGLLVPPADPAALAAAIRQLLADPARARCLACAGLARVRQEFSVEVMVQRVAQVYETLLQPTRGAR
ncbi:MAG: glycosyl transferase family 1, partial [Chloroflexi bacterium]